MRQGTLVLIFLMAGLLVLSILLIGFLIYSSVAQKKETREQYAFKCLSAIVALVSLCLTTLSSKQSLPDQIINIVARLMRSPIPEAQPAPVSEQILMVLLIGFAIYLISKSHQNWSGKISSDEEDRRRMKKPVGLIAQAVDETVRIAKKMPKRKLYERDSRIDPVAIPDEPYLVWHDHGRELFELWNSLAIFPREDGLGWNQRQKCWMGRERISNKNIFLYCSSDAPTENELRIFKAYAASVVEGATDLYVFTKKVFGDFSFVNGREVVGGMILLTEDFLLENVVDFSNYYSDVARRVESDAFANTELVVKDIYTPSSVSFDAEGENVVSGDLGLYLSEWSSRPSGKQIAVMGEYGQGKSTGALMFVYDSIKSKLKSSNYRIPILLELRGKSPANLSPPELLAAWGQQYQIQSAALMKLLVAGRLILIFEGFDEMANIGGIETRLAHFRSLWRFAFARSKIIFTGRRNLFFEDQELNVVFRGTAENASGHLCEVLHLCPFDEGKIIESLRWVDEGTRAEIVQAAKSNDQIFDIVARPALLFIVASLWAEFRDLLLHAELSSAQVIDRFVMHSYARQQLKEHDLGFMRLTTTERRYFHEGLAVYMASRDRTNQISAPEFRAIIERLYNAYPDNCHVADGVGIETDRPPLKVRLKDSDEPIDIVLTDVRTHGILVNDLGQKVAFRFAHKSFFEMLAAKAQAYNLLDIDALFYRSIKEAVNGNALSVGKYSPEILNFFSEFLVFHLRKHNGTSDLIVPAFDLVVGRGIGGRYFRQLRMQAVGMVHSRFTRRISLGLMVVFVGFALATSSEFFREILGMAPKVEEVSHEINWVVMIFSSLVGLLVSATMWHFTFSSSNLLAKSRLWIAVLICADNSGRTSKNLDSLIGIFGKGVVKDLVSAASEEYWIYPKSSPELASKFSLLIADLRSKGVE